MHDIKIWIFGSFLLLLEFENTGLCRISEHAFIVNNRNLDILSVLFLNDYLLFNAHLLVLFFFLVSSV